ncbi:MAG: hypothetical protein ACNS60_07575 [Candidatus Cyclobacteriaceae bacterium M2_1C_046]
MIFADISLIVFVIAFSTIPVYLLMRAANKRTRVLKKALAELTRQKKLDLKYDLWSNKIMGLTKENKLYYVTTDDNNIVNHRQCVDLNDLKECSLKINKKEIHNSDYSGKMEIKQIDMNLVMNRNNEVVSISLYDSNVDDILDYGFHLEVGKKWKKNIQALIPPVTMITKRAA